MKFLIEEFRKLMREIKTLSFKEVYVFISVAFIIFISFTITNTSFYFRYIGADILQSRIYWLLGDGLIMFLIPVFSVKFVFKEKLSDFGIRLGDVKFGLSTLILFLIVMLPLVWIVSASESFAETYPQGGRALLHNPLMFIFYEFCVLIYMLGWEFLWRGYMLFGLKEKFGYYAILMQMIPFFILHKGKPELELFGAIFAGIILGIQAWRSNSFVYSWILHWLIMLSIDSISIVRKIYNFYSVF
ncbi:MAG: CPBP family glutamic-type intramembrane protease [Ignavibacteria bacterium]